MHRIIVEFGPFTLYSYGLLIAAGFLLSAILLFRDSQRAGISPEKIFDCLAAILIGGLAGGRLLFVVINWEHYVRSPLRIIMVHEGGLAFHGAFAGALLAGAAIARVKEIPFRKTADLIAPYLALGQAVGRLGCFLNGCCYGAVLDKGIGVTFPGEGVMRIPVQIYSSLLLLAMFVILLKLKEKSPFDGYVFSSYMVLYGLFRFLMDFLRGDNPALFFGMTLAQIISAVMFISGIVVYLFLADRAKRE